MEMKHMFFKRKVDIEVRSYKESINIRAYCQNREVGRILCCTNDENRQIKIGDITCKKNNRGYGSLMMEKLIDFAKANKFDVITGWLSYVDKEHEKRLYHFYRKFGFEIIPNDEGMRFADIILKL